MEAKIHIVILQKNRDVIYEVNKWAAQEGNENLEIFFTTLPKKAINAVPNDGTGCLVVTDRYLDYGYNGMAVKKEVVRSEICKNVYGKFSFLYTRWRTGAVFD